MRWTFNSVVFSSLLVWCVWFFFWTFRLTSDIFPPLSTFDFIFCATLMIFLLFCFLSFYLLYVPWWILFFVSLLSSHIYFLCFDIVLLIFFSVFLIELYHFLDFSWRFSLLPWCYFVLPLTIYHSFLEMSLSLISHLSVSVSICSYIFCNHIW